MGKHGKWLILAHSYTSSLWSGRERYWFPFGIGPPKDWRFPLIYCLVPAVPRSKWVTQQAIDSEVALSVSSRISLFLRPSATFTFRKANLYFISNMCICVYTYIHIYDLCTHEFYVSIYREKYPQIACMCVYPPACKLSMCIILGAIYNHAHTPFNSHWQNIKSQ